MDKVFETAASQVPGMVILVLVVYAFIKYLSKRDNEHSTMIQEIHKENIIARQRSQDVIERNTVAATQNTTAMTEVTDVLRDLTTKAIKNQ